MGINSNGTCQTNATKTNVKPASGLSEKSSTDSTLSARSEESQGPNCSQICLPNMIVERLESGARNKGVTVSDFVKQLCRKR